jgi:hypothetical protein
VFNSISLLDIRITKYFQKSTSTPCLSHIMLHFIKAHGKRSEITFVTILKIRKFLDCENVCCNVRHIAPDQRKEEDGEWFITRC